MYTQSRQHLQREIYQSPACIYKTQRDLPITGMYTQSRQHLQREIYQSPACIRKADSIYRERSINHRHVYTKQREIYQSPACIFKAQRDLSITGMYTHVLLPARMVQDVWIDGLVRDHVPPIGNKTTMFSRSSHRFFRGNTPLPLRFQ